MDKSSASAPPYEDAVAFSSVPPNPYPNLSMQSFSYEMPQPMAGVPNMGMTAQPIMSAPTVQPSIPIQQIPTLLQTMSITSSSVKCRSCDMPLHTRVGYASTCCTHLSFLLCCFSGCCTLCAPFLYCTRTCREPRIYCVNCGERV